MKNITQELDRLLRKKFFILPSSQIYGGVSGLYDYGPYGVALKNNIIKIWREFFIDEENMYEIDGSILTPFDVLKASGHVDKFSDLLVFDKVNGECYRADHFLEQELNKLEITDDIKNILNRMDTFSCSEIDDICAKYDIKSSSGNSVGNCTHFNLMFKTNIGPVAQNVGFLRPETAQSQFVNFKKIYELNNEKLPFASASIGKVFRNEISPRSGLLRVREFEQAEIEYYVYPDQKKCSKFKNVEDIVLSLMFKDKENRKSEEIQTSRSISLGEAVQSKIIDNETLGYFIGRTFLFLQKIGIKTNKIRFRQHKEDEMAHYACECWDAEIETSYGWIECVGIADRSCFDLNMHQKSTGVDLQARKKLEIPIEKEKYVFYPDKKNLGRVLKGEMEGFLSFLNEIPQNEIEKMILEQRNSKEIENSLSSLNINNEATNLSILYKDKNYMIEVKKEKKLVHVEEITPNVIEPSFGIGRILYALLEHIFWKREDDENRNVLSFFPTIAPIKCVVTFLRTGPEYKPIVSQITESFNNEKIKIHLCERSVSIGKKYSSFDEIGVPFFITIDPESLSDNKCTIRERDTMNQVRVEISKVAAMIKDLIASNDNWKILFAKN